MNSAILDALATERTVDITTIGRRSGTPRRIEIWFYRAGGRYWLTGTPGRRDWSANLDAEPAFTFHLKQSVVADLAATARPIGDPAERRAVLGAILEELNAPENPGGLSAPADLDEWTAGSPLFEVVFDA
jgi:deazaflavin-dependent oxidoreductase (nitroreductase family)